MFVGERNGNVRDVSSLSFLRLNLIFYDPKMFLDSGLSTSLNFKVRNVSLIDNPLKLYAELENSVPNVYITILEKY